MSHFRWPSSQIQDHLLDFVECNTLDDGFRGATAKILDVRDGIVTSSYERAVGEAVEELVHGAVLLSSSIGDNGWNSGLCILS